MKRIAILTNQSSSLLNFWQYLIFKLLEMDFKVECIIPAGDRLAEKGLEKLGAHIIHYNLDRKGINPIKDMGTVIELIKIFNNIKPDILFSTTIKPVIYGCIAARITGVPCIYAMITGLGYAFETDTKIKKAVNKLAAFLYGRSLKHATGIFFQNKDDEKIFRDLKIISPDARILYANGTGVDTCKFYHANLPESENLNFLMIGRLLEAKGIREYAKACELLKKKYPETNFYLLGQPEYGRGSVSLDEVSNYKSVEYLGHTSSVSEVIKNSHVVVLPSLREGMPTAILEASSMGRPCVVTDVAGCHDVIINGENGFLVEVSNAESLAKGMEKFILHRDLIKAMGEKARKIAIEKYDIKKVTAGIISDMLKTCPDFCGKKR